MRTGPAECAAGKKLTALAGMIAADEDALICDFAQIYGVFDWRSLPLHTAAALAAGLGPGSRSEGARAGLRAPVSDFLIALCADRLALLLHFLGVIDAVPRRWAPELLRKQETEQAARFSSPEEYERWRAENLAPAAETPDAAEGSD